MPDLEVPFPWPGGKATIASTIWDRLGNVANYIEPFFGGGGAFFNRPAEHFNPTLPLRVETINDLDGFVCNFWRAVQADPEAVAVAADWPVNELDLHARGDWLFCRPESAEFVDRLRGNPDWFDAKTAGWWVWFVSSWIGGLPGVGGRHHQNAKGIQRRRPHLGDAGQGVSRRRPHLSDSGHGECARRREVLVAWMACLSDRMRNVRVCCGDWSRVCGPAVLFATGLKTSVFLDPPYAVASGRDPRLYAVDSATVVSDVRAWCLEWGKDTRLRIVLAGYTGEHEELERHGWQVVAWSANGGYSNQRHGKSSVNRHRERMWCSPHCLNEGPLFMGH